MIMYRGVFLPKVAYGVRIWSHALHTRTVVRKLGTLQRRALIGITGAYRSTSTAALQVLAGIPPLDLELEWLAAREDAKHLPEGLSVETLRRASTKLLNAWQSRWSTSQKGRWTHECFPDIRHRLTLPIALGHEIAQFLTGHGNFQSRLAELGLRPTPHCSCGNGNEDVRHVLYDCTTHDAHRASLELAANRAGFLWPTAMRDLVSRKDTYVALVRFAKRAKPRTCSDECQGESWQKRFTCGAVLRGHSCVGDAGGADADNSGTRTTGGAVVVESLGE
ncbi:Uncharacterized protein FWK35_00026272 [Aphis craccivora]|uniref:Reverse transcriptase domain-containing protein n=1 Tax=Aphis craccivora TaxID=307492 RepID=A0A6G0YDL1_APHCR|nr:Uncharacterized protein FWK35_00026272 [Aphis craccivora]